MRAMLHELYYQSKYVEEKHATDAGVQVEEQKGESEGEEKPKITEITNEDETSATIAITAADCSDNASVSDRLSNLSINDASSGSTSSLAKLPSSENLKITFLPCDTSITLSKKRYKYIGKFNTIFLSNTMAQHLEECVGLLKNNNSDAVIIVETVK